ncbi:MAG: calcium-binding EGF-like domain-containing protein [Chitinophagales bacterium]|nr:calcium-binding EGF-like domain-containing protein [Chitinophagales bacterium]
MRNAYLMLLLSALLFATCSKEDDSPPDPCEGIVCENGGSCVNGVCDCPEGWEGADCTTKSTPSSITLEWIEVIEYPTTKDNGESWDIDGGAPDIYVTITGKADNIFDFLYTSETHDNVSTTPLYYYPQIDLVDVEHLHSLYIWDEDGSSFEEHDLIGFINFKPHESMSNVWLDELEIVSPSKGIRIRFGMKYVF